MRRQPFFVRAGTLLFRGMLPPICFASACIAADLPAELKSSGHDDAYVYRLPYDENASFPVLQAYGSRFSHRGTEHYTVDFQMDEGTPVLSARDGIVTEIESAHVTGCWTDGCGRYANRVVVRHEDGSFAMYFHLATGSVVVAAGERVVRGQLLALSGNTGLTTTPHLHFGVYVPLPGGELQSIPVRFRTRGGPIEPRRGRRYLHPVGAQAAVGSARAIPSAAL